jgi:hypothetical protein
LTVGLTIFKIKKQSVWNSGAAGHTELT